MMLRAGMAVLAVAATLAGTAIVATASAVPAHAANQVLCDVYCDGRNPSLAKTDRRGPSKDFDGRRLVLHFDDPDNMAWASIDYGTPGDQVWMDRSFDGGYSWSSGSKLGVTSVPSGYTGWRTDMFNLDQWSSTAPEEGVVRACGQAGTVISCTPWARTTWNAADNMRAAATAMMQFYNNSTGLFDNGTGGAGWWPSAVDLTALIDNITITGMNSYQPEILTTYNAAKGDKNGDFRDSFMDDTGWWAMAWIDAYDLTGDRQYLTTAEDDAQWMFAHQDTACTFGVKLGGQPFGGILWEAGQTYVAAIANELFLYVTAALHNRIPGDTTYLDQARSEWQWLSQSGLINGSNLVTDGMNDQNCVPSTQVWTYNQGVVLEGLTELYRATNDSSVLAEAEMLATASTTSSYLNPVSADAPQGELCDPLANGGNELSFKGIYIRGLRVLNDQVGLYGSYLDRQSAVAHSYDRNDADQYGNLWAGPWSSTPQDSTDPPNAAQQGSAVNLANSGQSYAPTSPSPQSGPTALAC